MKRIIDRTLYDTETAEQVARYMPNSVAGGVVDIRETLYKRTDGKYFLYQERWITEGYSAVIYDEMDPSWENIVPFTEEEAVDWCEDRMIEGEIVIEEFSHLIDT